jgi:hypothetical protein
MYFIPRRNSSTALNAQPPPQDTSPYSYPGPESKETRSSMFYNVLPTVVQARLPRLPSIRRSISSIGEIGGRAMHAKSKSIIDTDSESSGTETPPPNYTSRRTSRRGSDFRGSRASMMSTDTEEFGFGDVQDLRDDVSERPVSSMSTPPPFTVLENRTGINWKYANQGTAPPLLARSPSLMQYRNQSLNPSLPRVRPPLPRPRRDLHRSDPPTIPTWHDVPPAWITF